MSYTSVSELMTGICDAIRAKDGTSATINHQDIPDRIAAIPTGGGGAIEEQDINFYDPYGCLVTSYSLSDLPLAALPEAPELDRLTFQEWNYTLASVNAATRRMDVGATYITASGKTEFDIRLTSKTGLDLPLYLHKSDTSTLTIEWGDGDTDTQTISGYFNISHTYATTGDYTISLSITSGTGLYALGNGTNSTAVVGGSSQNCCDALLAARLGSNLEGLIAYAFYSCRSLASVTIPATFTAIYLSSFKSCYSLFCVVLPDGTTSMSTNFFSNCYSLSLVIIPESVTSISASAFSSCCALPRVLIPDNNTSLDAQAFYNCYSLTSIDVPKRVSSIDNTCFYQCLRITEYHFYRATPPTLSSANAFSGINAICKIYVPLASVDAYKTATNWSTLANYIYGE